MCWSATTGWRAQSGWFIKSTREEFMKRKKQLVIAMLCVFSMMAQSVSVIAQSKDKKQEPKSGAQLTTTQPDDFIWIGEPAPDYSIQRDRTSLLWQAAAPFQAAVPFPPQVEFIHNEFSFDGKLVKDAPYSADAVTEVIQTLGDGNRIVRNSSAKIYRDSAGRTRREESLKGLGPWSVSGEATT